FPSKNSGPCSLLRTVVNCNSVRAQNPLRETMCFECTSKLKGVHGFRGPPFGCWALRCCWTRTGSSKFSFTFQRHYPANSCLLPLCLLYGAAVTTVEGVGTTKTKLHPIQERLAKCHGSQCGFCTPGMVMSMYSLLRNNPEPTMDQITACLCKPERFHPIDPTQDYIFPPELMRLAEESKGKTLVFNGERTTWISPVSLQELVNLKANYPDAPLVVGNTSVGIYLLPLIMTNTNSACGLCGSLKMPICAPHPPCENCLVPGILIGAAVHLAQLRDFLLTIVPELPMEKSKIYGVLLKQLRTLAGEQIRNLASLGGHIVSRGSTWDLNPVLAAGNALLNLVSIDGSRQIPLNDEFLAHLPQADLSPREVIVSVFIPFSKEDEFVSAFRQAERRKNALSVTNSSMRVLFQPGSGVIEDMAILYGGIGPTTVSARNTCQKLIGSNWDEGMLNEACRLILEEIILSPSAPGAKVEYRRTLLVSFFFRFYLQVLQGLKNMNPSKYPDLPKKYASALGEFREKPPQGMQIYQDVDPHQPPQDPVGRPIMHQSGIKHTTGEADYVDDMPPEEGQLYMAVVTSTCAHPFHFCWSGVMQVLYIGHIICGVLAESYECAKRARRKVKIEYQELELILTIEEAVKHKSFLTEEKKIERGNVTESFKNVENIIEGEIHVGGQEHFYLETDSVFVVPRKEDKEMDIYTSTQYGSKVQQTVASALNVQANRIMTHTRRVGGAFGGKSSKPSFFAAAAAVAAHKTGRPVRFILERDDDMIIPGGRHPLWGQYKVGFTNDGKIKAVDLLFYVNGGCTPDESELVIDYVVLKSCNAYDIPNFRSRGWACKTNLPSNTAFRGFGFPQTALTAETWVAAKLTVSCMSPLKVRWMNMYKGVSETPYKEEVDATNLVACWKECLEKSDYYNRRKAAEEFNKQNYWKKKGIEIIPMLFSVGFNTTYYHQAIALVHIYLDGSVLVSHGGVEMGQGIYTKMLQVASHELKIPLSYIHPYETTSVTIPNAVVTAGSIGTEVNGKAVQNACQILRKRLEPIMKKNPQGKWEDWVNIIYILKLNYDPTWYVTNMDWKTGEGHAFPYYVFGTACSEVEIDCLTGDHKNIRTDIVMDACFSINPAVDIGQIEGGFMQGLGLYTMEEIYFSPEGQQYTLGPDTYKIPAVCDVPEQFRIYLLPNSRNPIAIYSSKGVGEAGVFQACSVFFAIRDAVAAARKERGLHRVFTMDSPLNIERIRMACVDDFTEMVNTSLKTPPPPPYIPFILCFLPVGISKTQKTEAEN
uniref:FAD-binding PCMH-type domain-containing protein n=1 Tax=Podarcis muralis TaxID=64176 RepID=A0A670I5Z3_PODMU